MMACKQVIHNIHCDVDVCLTTLFSEWGLPPETSEMQSGLRHRFAGACERAATMWSSRPPDNGGPPGADVEQLPLPAATRADESECVQEPRRVGGVRRGSVSCGIAEKRGAQTLAGHSRFVARHPEFGI